MVTLAGGSPVKGEADSHSGRQCNEGENQPWPAGASLGQLAFGDLRPRFRSFQFIALDPALLVEQL